MVNQIIADYLKKYSDKYKLEDIKNKIISSGYSQRDFDDAVLFLGLDKRAVSLNEIYKKQRIANILGIIAVFLGVFGVIIVFTIVLLSIESIQNIIPGAKEFLVFDNGDTIVPLAIEQVLILSVIPFLFFCYWIVGGLGFLKHKKWSRILLIALSIISLILIPVGTVIGIIFLIFLFRPEIKNLTN